MDSTDIPSSPYRLSPQQWLFIIVAALVIGIWLWATPPGLLGKADAIGYALCHRIVERSLFIGNRQSPLCARCTGTYLGALAGLAIMVTSPSRRRAGGLPTLPFLAILIAFIAIMGIDGLNSYLTLLAAPHLYAPQNWLRLVTGAGNGLAMSALIYPIFNQTLWDKYTSQPVMSSFADLAKALLLAASLIALALSHWPPALYVLALASAASAMVLLTMLNTMIILMIARYENRLADWRQAWLPLLVGLTLATLQIGCLDALRYAIFQSWEGLTSLH